MVTESSQKVTIEEGRRQKAEGRGQKEQVRRGFRPLLTWGHQIRDCGGGLKPLLPLVVGRGQKTVFLLPSAFCPLPFLRRQISIDYEPTIILEGLLLYSLMIPARRARIGWHRLCCGLSLKFDEHRNNPALQ
ncbi:hypothetical protein NIES4075_74070 [Tolypothrix sp. NIES-4075]|nr:hypothetical protein NIES4075_74070 [Tolypothrix sp. NIES-4075]